MCISIMLLRDGEKKGARNSLFVHVCNYLLLNISQLKGRNRDYVAMCLVDAKLPYFSLTDIQVTGSNPQKQTGQKRKADNGGESQRGRPKKKKT